LADLLAAQSVTSVFFDNCVAGSVSIEQLGDELAQLISTLHYTDGVPVPEVDVVAHSQHGRIDCALLLEREATRRSSLRTSGRSAHPKVHHDRHASFRSAHLSGYSAIQPDV